MMPLDRTAEVPRLAFDRTRSARPGSIALVLLLGLLLVGAGAALLFAGHAYAEAYLLALMSMLAMAGVFLLLALAAGILRLSDKRLTSPILKSLVDRAPDGLLVTDGSGRLLYANAAYLDLIKAADPNDARPIERAFGGEAGVAEAVYRLLRAARENRRLQEEVRIGGRRDEPPRWLRLKVRPLGNGHDPGGLAVWTVADVTRELERQEKGFQELQTAIDYLDHAPAGFFSVDASGDIAYLNATLAEWLDYDLSEVGEGTLKLSDLVAGEGAALLTTLAAAPGEIRTEIFDIDLKTRSGRNLPVRLLHKVTFAADGAPGASRTLVLNRGSDQGADRERLAEVRFMRFFHNTPMAIATVDRAGRIARSNALFARLFGPARAGKSPLPSPLPNSPPQAGES
jgi:two-component system cell cycle sensor histidine kinase/response regulator CckA